MRVLIADKFEAAGVDGLKALGVEVVYEPGAGAAGLAEATARIRPNILVVRASKTPGHAMNPGLRAIIRAGAGVDNIDVPAATAAGIAVANCPGMNAIAVAELVMGHLICCDRRIPEQTAEVRAGRWNKKEYGSKARGLKGATLGVIGLGAIGAAVIKRALAFEMSVIGWSRSLNPAAAGELEIEFGGNDRAALLAMLPRCDAVSVHVALAPETRKLCDAAFFGAMKAGAIFVNTSRGPVVDEAALLDAARAKGLRIGVDVYDNQPATPQGELVTPLAAVAASLTHHCGASTEQAQLAVAEEVVRLVKVFGETGRLENCVNAPKAPVTVEVRPPSAVTR
jgi:D-3-phosphoglycerate dehydrogenase / 2-oxoglutarate reductase